MADSMQEIETEEVQIELEQEETTQQEVVVEEPQSDGDIIVEQTGSDSEDKDVADKEVADYSESVKKRINKLTYKIKEAERREQAAIEYAKNVQNELNKTNENLSQKDKSLYDEYSARVESQLASAEDRYKTAYDIGDTDAMMESQKDVAKLAVELESLNRVKPEKVKHQLNKMLENKSNKILTNKFKLHLLQIQKLRSGRKRMIGLVLI